MHSISYTIDELMLPEYADGAMFYGVAELVECDDTFRVLDIKLGPRWLDRCPYDGPRARDHFLFRDIAKQLEADEHVQSVWDDSMNELRFDRSEPEVYNAIAAE